MSYFDHALLLMPPASRTWGQVGHDALLFMPYFHALLRLFPEVGREVGRDVGRAAGNALLFGPKYGMPYFHALLSCPTFGSRT